MNVNVYKMNKINVSSFCVCECFEGKSRNGCDEKISKQSGKSFVGDE